MTEYETDLRLDALMQVNIENGDIPKLDARSYTFLQSRNGAEYVDEAIVTLPDAFRGLLAGTVGLRSDRGDFVLRYDAEANVLSLTLMDMEALAGTSISIGAPELSGSALRIPFSTEARGLSAKGASGVSGSLVLEYR